MMKLAFCLFNYFPYGGLQRDFLRIATLCHEHGHDIHVFTMDWQGEKPDWIKLNIIHKKGLSNHARAKHFSKHILKLTKQNFDKIIGFNKMPGLNIYYAADGCFIAKEAYQKSFVTRRLPRYRTYAQLEASVFNPKQKTQCLIISPQELEHYQDYYQTEKRRLTLLPPGISRDRIACKNYFVTRRAIRKKLGIEDGQFLLLSIATRFHTKGIDRCLQAIANLPKAVRRACQYFIIGDDKTATYQDIIKQQALDKHVTFLGAIDNIPDYLFSADLLIHPARTENTGTVILEAIVAGLPVLTTANCGYAHYVNDAQAGKVLEEPFTQEKLNSHLKNMLNHDSLTSHQQHALKYHQHADIFSLIDRVVEIIET